MQKLIFTFILGVFVFIPLHGQSLTTGEIEVVAKELTTKMKQKNLSIHNIVVSDFTDGKVAPTELGRYLAEEFTYFLSEVDGETLSVLDRSRLEALLDEQGLIRDELIDPYSAVQLGKLKGMEHLLYGTIIDAGEYYNIYVKLIEVETLRVLVSTRGAITKVPSLPKHIND